MVNKPEENGIDVIREIEFLKESKCCTVFHFALSNDINLKHYKNFMETFF